jgi:hypothetical protein
MFLGYTFILGSVLVVMFYPITILVTWFSIKLGFM